jgi:hypothetical protein
MVANDSQLAVLQGGSQTREAADGRRIAGLSLVAAYAGGEAFSIYAVFVAHSLKPVTFYLSEQNPFLRAVSGRYVEVFNPDGLILTVTLSLIVCVSIWWLFGGVARTLSQRTDPDPVIWNVELKAITRWFYRERARRVDAFSNSAAWAAHNVKMKERNL